MGNRLEILEKLARVKFLKPWEKYSKKKGWSEEKETEGWEIIWETAAML